MVTSRASNQCVAHEMLKQSSRQVPNAIVSSIKDHRARSTVRSIINSLDRMKDDHNNLFVCRNGLTTSQHGHHELASNINDILTDTKKL